MNSRKIILLILLGWILIGLLLGLDHTNSVLISGWQIIISGENLLTLENPLLKHQITVFVLSSFLIGLVYKFSESDVAKYLLIIELSIWLVRLFFFKEGYIIGYGGRPNEQVVVYDFISLVLRLLAIRTFLSYKPVLLTIVGALLLSVSLLLLKIQVFNM